MFTLQTQKRHFSVMASENVHLKITDPSEVVSLYDTHAKISVKYNCCLKALQLAFDIYIPCEILFNKPFENGRRSNISETKLDVDLVFFCKIRILLFLLIIP